MNLTFDALRRANLARLPQFKNAKGERAHSERDGSDWSLGEWCSATLGELGEAANLIKKIQRGDVSLDDVRSDLADELADTQTYLDLLAYRAGVDLSSAVEAKWDRVSERVGFRPRLSTFAQLPLGSALALTPGAFGWVPLNDPDCKHCVGACSCLELTLTIPEGDLAVSGDGELTIWNVSPA